MKHASWILAIVVTVAAVTPGQAQARLDEQSLKTAHETMINSLTAGNMTLLQAMIHPRALGFFRESQFPAQLKEGYTAADALPSIVTELGKFVTLPTTSTVYRVVGQVGIVCMTSALEPKKEEKEKSPRYLRGTYVYVSDNGNWRVVSWHSSDTPLAKK